MKKIEEVPVVRFLSKDVSVKGEVTFTLGNGQSFTAKLADYGQEVRERAEQHGVSQKIGDSASGCAKDKAYGAAFAAMMAVDAALRSGKWGADRDSGGGMLIQDLIAVISKLKGLDAEVVGAHVRVADEATVKGWLKNAKIDAEIKALRLKRAQAVAKDSDEEFEFTI